LKVACEAFTDARAPEMGKGPHLRTGAVVGIGLDLESTSFHLRWLARARVLTWARAVGRGLSEHELDAWAREVKDALAPELEATRTLGALGGIVPSRIARELQLGGPSFAVADDEASGLRAVEVGVRLLQRREVDAVLACAVDLAGDVRAVVARDQLRAWSPSSEARAFDARADGAKVGEGAAAVVLKRLDDAVAAGDRIYAVVRGFGVASGGAVEASSARARGYVRAARAAYAEAGMAPSRAGLIETHGSGVAAEDSAEAKALAALFEEAEARPQSVALGAIAAVVGQAGAAASLLSLVRAALCLHHEVLPPLGPVMFPLPAIDQGGSSPFHLPRLPEAWLRDRTRGPRVAGVSSMGLDGTCFHAVLEAYEASRARGPVVASRSSFHRRGSAIFLLHDVERDSPRLAQLSRSTSDIELLAVRWHAERRATLAAHTRVSRAIVVDSVAELVGQLERPAPAVRSLEGRVAFVFPGSGNHYVGMGRDLALALPEVYRQLDSEVLHLEGQLQPQWLAPRRASWADGWEEETERALTAIPERVIVAQVAHGIAVHDALAHLGVRPDAYLGYSLGESAALLASRTWKDRDGMFARTLASPLFRTELAGEKAVLRAAWGPEADWRVVIVTRPAALVRAHLHGTAALLIVNAPRECVVGGTSADIEATVRALGCEALPLDAVPTVHLPIVQAVRKAYWEHHHLPTTPPTGVTFYSGAWGTAYEPTADRAADSVTDNALRGFDFPAVVQRAWDDGIRIFVEVGPQGSCTRMIGRILEGRPHLAVSACQRGQDGYHALLVATARIAEAGGGVDLDALYGESVDAPLALAPALAPVVVGGTHPPFPSGPRAPLPRPVTSHGRRPGAAGGPGPVAAGLSAMAREPERLPPLMASFFASNQATIAAHEEFLRVSQEALALQAMLFRDLEAGRAAVPDRKGVGASCPPPPRFDRGSCLEFAVGRLEQVLGAAFREVDSFPTRVRLPDEPLMLVDRIMSVEGDAGELGPGRVVTEHDVAHDAWYLDGDRAPVCISVEAGQADLFLSAYLGIDKETRGERVYRLLDAKIVFHGDLPRPGDCIRYDIRIDRFLRQGDTWLFFFRFDGTIDGREMITMFDGCAGFFSADQLAAGAGIVPRASATSPSTPRVLPFTGVEPFRALVPRATGSFSDAQVDALRSGDLEAAFGDAFAGKTLAPLLRLPGGRMRLVDRIVSLDTAGGPEGKGEVVGEADIAPDAWFLTCHFKDDAVMPGTLMYECCLHTLRVLLLRLGWISCGTSIDLHYAPVVGVASELKCRGQVTAATKRVRYRVSIEQIGYGPEPFVIASAAMFADDKHVVQMDGMSVRVAGMSRSDLEAEWSAAPGTSVPAFDHRQIVAYAEGKPSECFGPPYRVFDHDRRLARLPRDPYLFLDRVMSVEAPPWVVAPGGWVSCEYDVPPDAWYFDAGGQGTMPFAVLLEVALQPCGWLAAYLGSALLSETDLHFRNLDGQGTQLLEVRPDAGTLTACARLTKTSQAGGMILQEFDLLVLRQGERVYAGQTGFGFFPTAALAAQVGLRGALPWGRVDEVAGRRLESRGTSVPEPSTGRSAASGLTLPARTLLMIDDIRSLDLEGGAHGFGLAVATKRVDPDEWFFRAHFYQDPVMPGSLGLEALLALMKEVARERFPRLRHSHRFEAMACGKAHRWQYRGQVVPTNREVRVEAQVTSVIEAPEPVLVADGQLSVDGKVIYAMKDFAVRLVHEGSQ
jgi:acyl transferase domain-containing protein/3-hydroxymyristoyl/3-hydroxydecanoyl-(acyl carrier protein) dehydratase